MGHDMYAGRLGAAAVALGIGAGLAAAPWVASAQPSLAAADAPGQNHAVSTDGVLRVKHGTATAISDGKGSVAIANGAMSKATATCTDCHAFVDGSNSEAQATHGTHNTARVFGDDSIAIADFGNNSTAIVDGNHSSAQALFTKNAKITVTGDFLVGMAESGQTIRVP